jgi:hypothetical protein
MFGRTVLAVLLFLFFVSACGAPSREELVLVIDENHDDQDQNPGRSDAGDGFDDVNGPDDPGPVGPGGALAPGSSCRCDTDCAGSGAHRGLCVNGICMLAASGSCASEGSQGECPAGSRCWSSICYPDCSAVDCAGACDGDGSCLFTQSSRCDDSCSQVCSSPYNGQSAPTTQCTENSSPGQDGRCYCNEGFVVNAEGTRCVRQCTDDAHCAGSLVCRNFFCVEPPCTADSCGAGMVCADSGRCVMDIGAPPEGPVPDCSAIPGWECEGTEAYCGALLLFEPVLGPGYWNYPINGETANNLYRSYARRDMVHLVKYVAGKTECLARGWSFGNGEPLGLGDMSEANGDIPGTSIGYPGHPPGTHVNGYDMDIAYFQIGTADNRLRSVCDHVIGGQDQYRCVSDPHLLDIWRTALILGLFHDTPQLRVIGVDGKIGPMVESAVDQLCSRGWLSGRACRQLQLAYEVTDEGRGWYRFHHHHFHISLRTRQAAGLSTLVLADDSVEALPCRTVDCRLEVTKSQPSGPGCGLH